METKREIDLEKARQYLVAVENEGKSLPEILIGFAEKQTTSQQQTIERLRELLIIYKDGYDNDHKVPHHIEAEVEKYFNTTEPIDQ